MVKSPWFIAVIPPEDIQEAVTALKREAAARFESRHALKSPPHVTLIPPFVATLDEISSLEGFLADFAGGQSAFSLTLSGFSSFPPRVIYVDVVPNKALEHLQEDLKKRIRETFSFSLPRYHGFHPHMTIAFRDLKPAVFPAAFDYFSSQEFVAAFQVSSIALLRHQDGEWSLFRNFFLE
jgi:2'-5' RNA ligase